MLGHCSLWYKWRARQKANSMEIVWRVHWMRNRWKIYWLRLLSKSIHMRYALEQHTVYIEAHSDTTADRPINLRTSTTKASEFRFNFFLFPRAFDDDSALALSVCRGCVCLCVHSMVASFAIHIGLYIRLCGMSRNK